MCDSKVQSGPRTIALENCPPSFLPATFSVFYCMHSKLLKLYTFPVLNSNKGTHIYPLVKHSCRGEKRQFLICVVPGREGEMREDTREETMRSIITVHFCRACTWLPGARPTFPASHANAHLNGCPASWISMSPELHGSFMCSEGIILYIQGKEVIPETSNERITWSSSKSEIRLYECSHPAQWGGHRAQNIVPFRASVE